MIAPQLRQLPHLCVGGFVGLSAREFTLLIYGDEHEDFTPDEPSELRHWVVHVRDARLEVATKGKGVAQLSRASTGELLLMREAEVLRGTRHPAGWRWRPEPVLAAATRLWSLDDGRVCASEAELLLVQEAGSDSWSRLPSPGPIEALSTDGHAGLLAGLLGRVAAWDGSTWHEQAIGARTSFAWLAPSRGGEAVAGTRDGRVFHRRAGRWTRLRRRFAEIRGLVRWRGRLILAAGADGLFEYEAGKLRLWQPNSRSLALEVGDQLLCPGAHGVVVFDGSGARNERRWRDLGISGGWVTFSPWCELGR